MERVYEELDEAKAEIVKLRAEYKSKVELSENLKKSHNEQLVKIQEASLRIEKQAKEINEKAEEIAALIETFEDVQRSLNQKESIIRRLSAANEKLRIDCDEKLKKLEDENKGLVSALEKANGKNFDQKQQIHACKEEIEGLKGTLSVSQKKCLEAEKKAKGTKEESEREGVLLKLEEEKGKIEEQLKWKKEQFTHLEEAHGKMRDEFKKSKKEWELEKSSLLDEICSLQSRLDSQTRTLEDLQNRLQMCNQVLAHEESRRKSLEVQLSDVKGRFENVFDEYEDAKSQLECLTEKRDEEIASLRHSVGQKEAILKEMEYQKRQMEQENQDLRSSLKELQESQIKNASGLPSAAKLQNKLKCLEEMHKESAKNLKAKEAELNSQLEKMTRELKNHELQLQRNDETIKELEMELEQMHANYTENLRAKEAEWNSQLEKVTNDLNNCRYELESNDAIIKELGMEFKQAHGDSAAKFKDQEDEWKNQLEMMTEDLHNYRYQIHSKEEMIKQLKMELEKMHEDHSADLRAKEAERNSQLKKVTSDLNNYRSELESRDATIKALRIELEQVRGDSAAKFKVQEAEWKYQIELMTEDLNESKSELENRDEIINELKIALEKMREDHFADLREKEAERNSQLEKLTSDLDNCRSELESRDVTIKALRMEFEQVHGEFLANLKTKEAEWNYQLDMMTGDLNRYKSDLVDKDARIKEFGIDLEDSHSSSLQLELQNEEISLMLLVLQDGISEAQLKIANEKADMDWSNKEKEQKISLLMQQLEMKSSDIDRLQKDIKKEQENAASLSRRVESLGIIGQQQFLMQKDLDRYEEMLIESSTREVFLREQFLHMESVLNKKLREVCDDQDRTNTELTEKICEGNQMEFELYIWKSVAEHFKVELEENFEMRKELEASLLAQVDVGETIKQEKQTLTQMLEENGERIDNLQQQIALLEQNLRTKEAGAYSREMEKAMSFELEKARFSQIIEEKDRILEQLQKEVGWLEQESLRRELEELLFAKIEGERTIEHEKEKLMQLVVDQKSQRLNDLMQLVESLEHKFNGSLISFSSQLAEKQAEIDMIHEAWEKITTAEIMAALEIEEKKLMIVELEDDIRNVQQKLELQQKSTSDLKQQASEVEAKLEAKELEMMKLGDQLKTKLKNSDALIEELKSEKRDLLEDITKLSSERENLLGFVGGLDDRIGEFSSTDKQLMDMLETIMLSCDNHGSQMDAKLEMMKLGDQLKTKLKNSDALIEELKSEKRDLLEDITKLSSERENLLGFVGGLDDRIGEFSSTDKQLMDMLETIMLSCDNHGSQMDANSDDEHSGPAKENVDSPAAMKRFKAISDVRSPFREINSQM